MKRELKYIIMEYSDKDLPYIEQLCEYIDLSCDEIIEFFNINNFGEKVHVKLFDDLNAFREFFCVVHGKNIQVDEIPKWMCGFAPGNSVYTLCLEEYRKTKGHDKDNLNDLKYLVMHEFTHSCHNKIKNNSGYAWLNEGLATTLSHQYDERDKLFNFTLEQAINGGPNYINYYTMFSYVYENYGKEYILELVNNFESLKEVTPTLYEETKERYGSTKTK